MTDQNNENTQPKPFPEPPPAEKQLSPLARWAFRFLIAGVILAFIGIVAISFATTRHGPNEVLFHILLGSGVMFWIIAFILGVLALVQIRRNNVNLKGVPRSLASVLIPAIYFTHVAIASYHAYFIFTPRLMCGTNLRGLGKIMMTYSTDYNGKLPTASQWCDLLVECTDVNVRTFLCPDSDAVRGESSYAMNKYIADINMTQLPADIVLLFETDYGRTAKRNWWKLRQMRKKNDDLYSITESNGISKLVRSDKLDKLRWNQVGGPEILSTEHYNGEGCNILFGDGHVSFESSKTIPNLRWKP